MKTGSPSARKLEEVRFFEVVKTGAVTYWQRVTELAR
jgi:hypothetical protein